MSTDSRTASPSPLTPASVLADEAALKRAFDAEFESCLTAAKSQLGDDATNLAPRVVETAFVNLWSQRATVATQQQLKTALAEEMRHGSARALSRRHSAGRFAGGKAVDRTTRGHRVGGAGRRLVASREGDSRTGRGDAYRRRRRGPSRGRESHEDDGQAAVVGRPAGDWRRGAHHFRRRRDLRRSARRRRRDSRRRQQRRHPADRVERRTDRQRPARRLVEDAHGSRDEGLPARSFPAEDSRAQGRRHGQLRRGADISIGEEAPARSPSSPSMSTSSRPERASPSRRTQRTAASPCL